MSLSPVESGSWLRTSQQPTPSAGKSPQLAARAFEMPLETSILNKILGGSTVHRFVDLGLNVPLLSVLNGAVPYINRPWEREARTLARR